MFLKGLYVYPKCRRYGQVSGRDGTTSTTRATCRAWVMCTAAWAPTSSERGSRSRRRFCARGRPLGEACAQIQPSGSGGDFGRPQADWACCKARGMCPLRGHPEWVRPVPVSSEGEGMATPHSVNLQPCRNAAFVVGTLTRSDSTSCKVCACPVSVM
jgi:hypothetical protein